MHLLPRQEPRSRRFRPLLVPTILATVALLVSCPASVDSPEGDQGSRLIQRSFLGPDGSKFLLNIVPDRIGILVHNGKTEKQVQDWVAQQHSLGDLTRLGERIYSVEIDLGEGRDPDTSTLDALKDRALEFQNERASKDELDLIRRAGLMLDTGVDQLPLILINELIVHFRPNLPPRAIRDLIAANEQLEHLLKNPFNKTEWLIRVKDFSLLETIESLQVSKLVVGTYPNFGLVRVELADDPPLSALQWHIHNMGEIVGVPEFDGIPDADLDLRQAWEITEGSEEIVIAILDNGFDLGHPDLERILWKNPEEDIEGAPNGVDDDEPPNDFLDDIVGANFGADNEYTSSDDPSDPSPGSSGEIHGTAVAGLAVSFGEGSNDLRGACPNCRLMLLRFGDTVIDDDLAIGYAISEGASIISYSYAHYYPQLELDLRERSENLTKHDFDLYEAAIGEAVTVGRGGKGIPIFFGLNNLAADNCTSDWSAGTTGVIAVGGVHSSGSAMGGKRIRGLHQHSGPGVCDRRCFSPGYDGSARG